MEYPVIKAPVAVAVRPHRHEHLLVHRNDHHADQRHRQARFHRKIPRLAALPNAGSKIYRGQHFSVAYTRLLGAGVGMIEFIDDPCGWTGQAPAGLRRQAPDGASAWRKYSTARFLGDLDPVVIRTIEFGELKIDSGMQIELLPDAVADGLRTAGLELASEEYMIETAFQRVLANALNLIAKVPPLLGTVAGLCRSVHALVPPNVDVDVSYSEPSLPFSIFVSCPPAPARHRVERLAENIMHEALHLQLSLVETVEPLVISNEDEPRFFSPWKNEPRTVHGLLHGVYVFGNLRYFWSHIANNAIQGSAFAERRVEEIDSELATVKHLLSYPALTVMGQRLATKFLA